MDPAAAAAAARDKIAAALAPLPWTFPKDILEYFPTIAGKKLPPRPQQTAAIRAIDDAFKGGKLVVVLEMPTGGGKSPLCLTFAEAMKAVDGDTHFLTIQRALQDQYTRDFPAPQIEVLKGRGNYLCSLDRGRDCADAPCTDRKRGILPECVTGLPREPEAMLKAMNGAYGPDVHLCPYWKQLVKCLQSPITLFNFSSFLFQQQIGRFGARRLLIIDEAHNIEGELLKFVTLELTEWALRIIDLEIDRQITSKAELVEWLREKNVAGRIADRLDRAGGKTDDGWKDSLDDDDLDRELDKAQSDALRELAGKIDNFLGYLDQTEWIIETVEYEAKGQRRRKISARPLFARDFARDLLFSKADRVLVMSATILDVGVWAANLGLKAEEIAHVSTPNEFPIENRPVYLEYAGNFGHKFFSPKENPKDPTQPKFVSAVKRILKRHEGQRGIIHCHSFKLSKILEEEVASPRFLFQQQFAGDKTLMLAELERVPDGVIVAPAMHEGIDLKGDLSRFQVIAKVPWPDMTDKVVKERMARDSRWYAWLTALKLVQSYGRSIRSADDWATTYILDSGFEGFLQRNRTLLPKWMRDAFHQYAPTNVRRA